ncbi:MAG: hypothetical protein ACE366_20025 [Bradymonadia bacterium]
MSSRSDAGFHPQAQQRFAEDGKVVPVHEIAGVTAADAAAAPE